MDDVYQCTTGPLKLKTNSLIKKKKKRGKKKNEIKVTVEPIEEVKTKSTSLIIQKTKAEEMFEQQTAKKRDEMILERAQLSHKDRVQKFNDNLDKESEYHDVPKMSLIDEHLMQYKQLSEQINNDIIFGQKSTSNIEGNIADLKEIIEQIELEQIELEGHERRNLKEKINRMKNEVKDLKRRALTEVSVDLAHNDDDEENDYHIFSNERSKLLEVNEKIEKGTKSLQHGYRVALETDAIANDVLENLDIQREQLNKSHQRLQELNGNLSRSSRMISSMILKAMQNKLILFGVIVGCVVIMVLLVYVSIRKHS
ncbi:hypothetical protein SNEBB_002028 [Seison nebaliae]|nr:hypothetical protein SNEBB_002028 [Seison nebaliae]